VIGGKNQLEADVSLVWAEGKLLRWDSSVKERSPIFKPKDLQGFPLTGVKNTVKLQRRTEFPSRCGCFGRKLDVWEINFGKPGTRFLKRL
jgi:hypothetical protein